MTILQGKQHQQTVPQTNLRKGTLCSPCSLLEVAWRVSEPKKSERKCTPRHSQSHL